MRITLTPPAQMVLDQLSPQDRQRVEGTLGALAAGGGRDVPVSALRDGARPYFMVRASDDLRILFERRSDVIDVIDIATHAQLTHFRQSA